MQSCWRLISRSRLTFDQLMKILSKMLPEGDTDHYISLNEPYAEWNKTNAEWITDNTTGASVSQTTVQFLEDQLYFNQVVDCRAE